MTDNSIDRLIDELLQATLDERAEWTREGDGGQRVTLATGGGEVNIYPEDWDGSLPFVMFIRNPQGDIVERIVTSTEQTASGDSQLSDRSERIVELYDAARDRSVAGIVDDILRSLNEPPRQQPDPVYGDEEPF